MITSMSNKKGNSVLSSYNYTYNFDGNQATKTDNTGRKVTYGYDKLGRLTSEDVTGVADAEHTTYQYDFAGNRIQMSVNGNVNNTYTYDKNNRLLRENCIDTSTGQKKYTNYDYDKNGNMKRKSSATSDITSSNEAKLTILNKTDFTSNSNYTLEYYKYNVFNQLTDYSNNKGKKASYKYLPNGLRSSKTVGGVKTEQIWDNQNLLMEINSNGDIANLYEYVLDMIKNKKTDTYYNYDAHGDVVQLTDQNGVVTQDYTYDAFGNQKSATNVDNPFRYCGEYYDNETGLIYLRNRYYNPETGRFINEDPIRDGLNWYSYCHSNPVNFYDMFGLADSAHLDVPKLVQHNQSDCWAAVAAMIIVYYDEDKEESDLTNLECDVVNKVEDRTDDAIVNSTNIASENIQPKRWETVNDRLGVESPNKDNYEEGMAPKYYTGYDNVSAMEKQMLPSESLKDIIRREIDAKNPVILFYNDKDNGHFVLVTGYDMKNGKMIVTYNDPASENVDSVERTAGIDEMSSQLPGTSFNYNSAYSTNKVMERVD